MEPASLSGGGLSAWSGCVGDSCDFSSHLGEGVWYCMVYFPPPSARATSLLWRWSCTLFRELLTTTPDFPVDYLLPRRAMCLDRCGAPAGLQRPPPSQCYIASSPVRVATFQYHFFISLSFFPQVFIYWLVWSWHLFSTHIFPFDRYLLRPTRYHLVLGWGHR